MKFRLVLVLALLLMSATANAAELNTSGGSQVYNNTSIENFAPIQFTQNFDITTIEPVQVACGVEGVDTTQNWYLRRFFLSTDHGIAGPLTVQSVSFGVEQIEPAQNFAVDVVLLQIANGAPFLFANMFEMARVTVVLTPGDIGTIVNVAIGGVIADPVARDLVVAIDAPDGSPTGLQFRPGANSIGALQDAYIAAVDCGIPDPVGVSSIGFPDSQTIFVVNGDVGGPPAPGACCFGEVCAVLSDTECTAFGGIFDGTPSCQPNPCRPPRTLQIPRILRTPRISRTMWFQPGSCTRLNSGVPTRTWASGKRPS